MEIQRFEVAIPEADVVAMYARLRDTRWAADLGNENWRYGVQRE